MESACHCSVQAGKLLWLLVQGSMYSLQNGYMPSLAQAGPVHMAVMRAFCIGVKLQPVLCGCIWSWDKWALGSMLQLGFLVIHLCFFLGRSFFLSLFQVTLHLECVFLLWCCLKVPVLSFFELKLHWMMCSKSLLKLSSCWEAFNLQDWVGSGLLRNSQMHVLWVLGPGCSSVSFFRSLGSAELP